MAMDETGEKRSKLAALQLTEAEWKRVDLFLNLLAVRVPVFRISSLFTDTITACGRLST
jgi:hypothetical protein